MFTGLVEDLATVETAQPRGDGIDLSIRTRIAAECRVGNSVAIDGACLTVTAADGATLSFVAVAETLARTTLGEAGPGRRCNVERASRFGDPIGGHFVQGHVDAVGRILRRHLHGVAQGGSADVVFSAPGELLRYVVVKGSIAVDGVSLTVTAVGEGDFSVALIPHTLAHTTLGLKREGDRVHLEADVLAKHVERLLEARARPASRITMDFLREHGYV